MKQFIDFINKSYTAFHAIKNLEGMLEKANFKKLTEDCSWELEPGCSYYVIRNTSSIIAFKVPKSTTNVGFNIVASHSDSPSFKVKPNGVVIDTTNDFCKLNTEGYGGMITYSWFDRPLGVAGRVYTQSENSVKEHLVNFDETLVIPSVAIHLNRSGEFNPNMQIDMLPLFGNSSTSFDSILKKYVGDEEVISHDLFLYNKEEARLVGASNEYILSSRLDDLECAYTSIKALIESDAKAISLCAVFNNEEVGSRSNNGADSTFLIDTVNEIISSLKLDTRKTISKSFIVSSDNAHAVHPNHPEKADPTNRVYMNKGVVIKHQAGLSYTTDAYSEAVFKKICKLANVDYQDYTNRSDQRGGSTLGAISLGHLSIPSADIGLAQLAMHSTLETAGVLDFNSMINAIKKYFELSINKKNDTTIIE